MYVKPHLACRDLHRFRDCTPWSFSRLREYRSAAAQAHGSGHEEHLEHREPQYPPPMKDGYYDHSQNCVEYIVLQFGPTGPTQKQAAQEEPDRRHHIYYGPNSWMAQVKSCHW